MTTTRIDLSKLRVVDLKAEAKKRGLRGYSKLRKAELINFLKQSEQANTYSEKPIVAPLLEKPIP